MSICKVQTPIWVLLAKWLFRCFYQSVAKVRTSAKLAFLATLFKNSTFKCQQQTSDLHPKGKIQLAYTLDLFTRILALCIVTSLVVDNYSEVARHRFFMKMYELSAFLYSSIHLLHHNIKTHFTCTSIKLSASWVRQSQQQHSIQCVRCECHLQLY